LYKEVSRRKKQPAGDRQKLPDATAGTNFFNPKEVDFFKINLPKARARGLKKIFPGAMADRPGNPVKKFYPRGKKILPGKKILQGTNPYFKRSKTRLTGQPYVIC
jgi:hypothetical protein